MRSSFHVGRIAGIDIGLHWSIAMIAGLLTLTLSGTVFPATASGYAGAVYLIAAMATAALFLGSIIAHELGHSVVAQNNDVGVKGITLFALGGIAELESEPRTAGAAARIALAGPAVSVAIGIGSLVAAAIAGSLGFPAIAVAALTWLGVINLALAVFNMIPALPLDGGRVLQAAVWHRNGDRHQATISAAKVGIYIGWAIVGVGMWQLFGSGGGGSGLWTAFIGWFVLNSARAEGARATSEVRRQRSQSDPMSWSPRTPPPPRHQNAIDVDVIDVTGRPSTTEV
jgi:Zn-dependent protease